MLAAGLSRGQIAERLGISPLSVKSRLASAYKVLGVQGRRRPGAAAVTVAALGGQIQLPQTAAVRMLTPRQAQIVRLIATGMSNAEIAALLTLSQDTIRSHVRGALERAGARDRVHLVALAIASGVVAPRRRVEGAAA